MTLIINELNPTTEFTRILNSVIFDKRLTPYEFRLWCQLAALPRGQKMTDMTAKEIAEECGMNVDTCRDQRRALKNKGFLKGDGQRIIVTVPDADFQPKEVKLDKHQQLRHDLRDVWNKYKPDAYTKMRNPLAEREVTTLAVHAKHNNAEKQGLAEFLRCVLTGAKALDWWNEKDLNFTKVFGSGTPKQGKFTNVEKLFKASTSRKAKAVTWDHDDDKCWINWFHSKKATEYTKVERFKVENRMEAFLHNQDNPAAPDTIRVYQTHSGRPCLWTRDNESRFTSSALPTNA